MIKSKKYKGIDYDSIEEVLFATWLDCMQSIRIVEKYEYHSETFKLILKKPIVKLRELNYTPDFIIYYTGNKTPVYVDIKGTYSKFSDSKYFSTIQKVTYELKGIYVQKVVIPTFFENSFYPPPYKGKKYNTFEQYRKEKLL